MKFHGPILLPLLKSVQVMLKVTFLDTAEGFSEGLGTSEDKIPWASSPIAEVFPSHADCLYISI